MLENNNLPSITVGEFSEIVKAQFTERNYRPIFGLGKGGIGKTESIESLTKELGIGYVDIRLLLYSETDLKGIPYPNADHTKTVWLANNILPTSEKDGDTGILVLDEITSANRSVRTAAYQLLNERRLGEYRLPDKWMIVCLGNGEEDGGDYQGMEGNFANRCAVFNVVPNVDSFKDWAFTHGINELVTAYINFKPGDLHSYNPEAENELLFSSPRTWKAISDILNSSGFDPSNRILKARIIGNLGQRVGNSFISFCKYKSSSIDPERIIKNGEMPKANSLEVINITVQSIIKLLSDKINLDISSGNEIQYDTINQISNGMKWILSLKTEFAVMGIRDLIRHNPDIMRRLLLNPILHQNCPELLKFANNNEEVFK